MLPVRKRQQRALERHDKATKQYEADYARWEKEHLAWKRSKGAINDPPAKPEAPQSERFIASDTTVEALAPILSANPRGLLLARDELSGWVGSFDRYSGKGKASADVGNWLSMFNAESITVDRKTGYPRTIHIPQAAVSIIGGIQPGILRRVLGTEHKESGLAARLLLTSPPRKAKHWTDADIEPKMEEKLARLFDRLHELKRTKCDEGEAIPVLIQPNSEAKQAFISYFNSHAQEQVDLTGDLSAAWSKLEEYAARLALVVHFVRWAASDLPEPNILDVESMSAGITLAKWFKGEATRVYTMLSETDTERDDRRLLEWIDRKGGSVTTREVQQGCRWLKEPGAAEMALEKLVKEGWGSWEPTPSGQRGQPTRRFRLSTLSTSTVIEKLTGKVNTVDVDIVDAPKNAPTDNPNDGRLFTDERGLPD